jgi:hypothetical protein
MAIKLTLAAPDRVMIRVNDEIKQAALKGYFQVEVQKDWNEAITGKIRDIIESHGFTTNDKSEYILIRWM